MEKHITEEHVGEDAAVCPTSPDPQAYGGAGGQLLNNGLEAPSPGAAAAAAATPPANQLRARNRRERGKLEYHPTAVRHAENSEAKPKDEVVMPQDTVRLDYEFVLRGGHEEVVRVKSQLILPMALALENLPLIEQHFPELIDRVLVQPLNTKFRAFLQRRFDAASRAAIEKEAAEKETPPPANMEFKQPKPTNGSTFTMPGIDCRPPLPTRPGSPMGSLPKNGG